MYLKYFGLEENPFNVTPDTRYRYPTPAHEEVLETLRFGVDNRKGFLLLSGEVGTGKTITLRALLNTLPDTIETSLILNPQLSARELLHTINKDFGCGSSNGSMSEEMDQLNQFVLKSSLSGRNALVIIDEAQDLSMEALEMTRLLSNLETETDKLLQILLAGQPELQGKLAIPALRQLRQRIQIHCRLQPLDLTQTEAYITFRIQKAGPKALVAFEKSAVEKIHHYSRGVPRLINTICDFCLMAAYLHNTRIINNRIVEEAFKETRGEIPYVTHF